ncbi:RagB/SusD family nutrient uptake outer membrane protein [Galbibacter mesophilus]|uniref:RagB/SusD family nutrient uptake outer membrane protein n=1 Tax=Galbibacter mesophilus TaxID=379069 RepID=UPI00191E4F19|nr:RagB/SusD family nutrient uptake outer membrane protein [Galbibacter mesophilus]MCM5662852.1 RagB/SusD family nutrient uptake outer membrane protein [Galbibacter mesophilus]
MKKLYIIFSLLAFAACEDDFLDVPLEDSTPAEEFFVTQADALEATNQIYAYQRNFSLCGFPYLAIFHITSDDSDKGSNPGDAAFLNDFDRFTFDASAFSINGYWVGQYRGINFANQVITNVPDIEMNADLKNRLLAEAKFFRGYHYFNLVRVFAGVPIYDGLPEDGNYNIPRNTKEEVYDFAIQNLTEAAEVLPVSYGATDEGRATKGAAKGLLAKIALYQKDWAKAKMLTEEIMGMGYSLFPDYYQLFRYQNEYNSEVIFDIQSTADGNCQATSQYGQIQGVRAQYGWGFNSPSEDLANAYETGDLRRDASILFVGETTPEGDLITAGNDPSNPTRYNQKIYVPSSDFRRNNCAENSDSNIPVLRYADVLLMNAEANNELGNTPAALESLNKVRERAGLSPSQTASQSELRMEIYHERRVELALEGERFFDLVRTGRAGQVLRSKGKSFKDGINEIFPIPSNQITLSNNVLTQNPGY